MILFFIKLDARPSPWVVLFTLFCMCVCVCERCVGFGFGFGLQLDPCTHLCTKCAQVAIRIMGTGGAVEEETRPRYVMHKHQRTHYNADLNPDPPPDCRACKCRWRWNKRKHQYWGNGCSTFLTSSLTVSVDVSFFFLTYHNISASTSPESAPDDRQLCKCGETHRGSYTAYMAGQVCLHTPVS